MKLKDINDIKHLKFASDKHFIKGADLITYFNEHSTKAGKKAFLKLLNNNGLEDALKNITLKPEVIKKIKQIHTYPNRQVSTVPEQQNRTYKIIKGKIYLEAMEKLSKSNNQYHPTYKLPNGEVIFRPLTLKESMQACIDKPKLIKKGFTTCTGIVGGGIGSKVKPLCDELIINKDKFINNIKLNYNEFEGEEFKITSSNKKEITLIMMGGNTPENEELYEEFRNIIYQRKAKNAKAHNILSINMLRISRLQAINITRDAWMDKTETYIEDIDLTSSTRFIQINKNPWNLFTKKKNKQYKSKINPKIFNS